MDYITAIGAGFPGVEVHALGDGLVYANIVWDAGMPLPSKQLLDDWIAQKVKDDMWECIKRERDRRKLEGGYQVGLHWFHSDTFSRTQHLGLVIMGTNVPPNLNWKTMSGDFVLMTPTLASQIFQTAAASDAALFTVAEQKRAEMTISPNPANYNYLTAWPITYGE